MNTVKYNGYTIEISPDDDPMNPRREYDQAGKMICFHRRYDLGDKHEYKSSQYEGWNDLEQALIQEEDAAIILPLYLYDHSGITISTSPFNCPWDSGQVGWILMSKASVIEEFGDLSDSSIEKARKRLLSEVREYDQYLIGDVWGFVIKNPAGKEVDSCWGFYGYDYCVEEAKACVPEEEGANV